MIWRLPPIAQVVLTLAFLWQIGFLGSCLGQGNDTGAEHIAYLLKRQRAYTLERVSDNRRVSLEPAPLIRWYNPVSGARGGVFVWTLDNRPVAMTKCHLNDRKQHYVESSVAFSDGLALKLQSQTIWSPEEPALKDVSVEDNLVPASSSVRRLLQMRQLAASFSIQDQWGEDGEPYQLRLMPRPLYRYTSEQSGVLDGAVFAFVQGTNPEAVVVVEAVRKDGVLRWRCGISRLTGYALNAERNGATVYTVKKMNHPARRDSYRHLWAQPRPYPINVKASIDQ